MNRSSSLVLAALTLAFPMFPASAGAQVDVQEVSFVRGVDRIDGGAAAESAFAEVVVVGDGITSVVLTFPDLDTAALTEITPREFRLGLQLVDEAELDAEFPAGSYQLEFNTDQLVVTIDHTFPAVPSPAVSSPVHESDNNSPTMTAFTWTGCPGAVCGEDTDHVFASIFEGPDAAASAFLPAGTGSFSPPELTEDADFTFFVDNVAYRVGFEIADVGDPFVLVQSFIQSDSVDFSTGFRGLDEAPQGDFTIVVSNPALGILDPSGNVNTTLAGVELDYDFEVSPAGKVSGAGNADVDGDGSRETPVTIKGKLKGKQGLLTLKVSAKIKSKEVGTEASAKYAREQEATVATQTFTGDELLKGKVLGVKVEEGGALAGVIAVPVSWQLDFNISTIDGRTLDVTGVFITGAGANIDLTGSGTYSSEKGTTSFTLKSGGDDKGASFSMKELTVDALGDPSGGTLTYKAFGQSGAVPLP